MWPALISYLAGHTHGRIAVKSGSQSECCGGLILIAAKLLLVIVESRKAVERTEGRGEAEGCEDDGRLKKKLFLRNKLL